MGLSSEATARLCRKGDRWWVVLTFADGESLQSEDDFGSQAEAQAALDTWCRETGSPQQTAQ